MRLSTDASINEGPALCTGCPLTPLPGFAGYSPKLRGGESAPSPGFAGYSPDFAGESLPPSPGFAGYSPDFAG